MSKFASLRDEVIYSRADFDDQFSIDDCGGDWYGFVRDFYGKPYLVREADNGFVDVLDPRTAVDAETMWDHLRQSFAKA